MDVDGNVLDSWFGKSIIRSCSRLSYGQAQRMIEWDGVSSGHEKRKKKEARMWTSQALSKLVLPCTTELGKATQSSVLCFSIMVALFFLITHRRLWFTGLDEDDGL